MSLDPAAALELGTVRVVGTGLLGTSVGLGLSASGARVLLADASPTALALARDLGAGAPDPGTDRVDLVVVAAPPDVTADVVAEELKAHPDAVVTDVAQREGAACSPRSRAVGADLRPLRRQPPDGRPRALRRRRRPRRPVHRPALGALPGSGRRPGGPRPRARGSRSRSGAVPVVMPAGRARRRRRPGLARAAGRRQPRRGPAAARARTQPWRSPARACATSPGSPAATRCCGRRSSPRTPARSPTCSRELRDDLDGVIAALRGASPPSRRRRGGRGRPAIGARGAVARARRRRQRRPRADPGQARRRCRPGTPW